VPDSGWIVARTADNHDVGYMNRALFFNDPPPDVFGRIGARMALQKTDTFHDNPVLVAQHAQDPAYFVDIFACDYLHLIVLSKLNWNLLDHVK